MTALAAAAPSVQLFAWYRIHDLPPGATVIGDENDLAFGVLDTAGAPKPARDALAHVVRLFGRPIRSLATRVATRPAGQPVEVHAFERSDAVVVILAWLPTPPLSPPAPEPPEPDRRTVRATVALPFVLRCAPSLHDAAGNKRPPPDWDEAAVHLDLEGASPAVVAIAAACRGPEKAITKTREGENTKIE